MFASTNLQRRFLLTAFVALVCLVTASGRPLTINKSQSNTKAIPAHQDHVLILESDGDAGCSVVRSEKQFRDLGVSLSRAEGQPPSRVDVVYSVAQSTFEATYTDFPVDAQAAFQRAVDIWAARVSSTQTIKIDARYESFGNQEVLGSAGPTFIFRFELTGGQTEKAWFPSALADALTEDDLQEDEADIIARFNSDFPNWHFETDQDPGPGEFDFTTVVLHEIGHGLGFSSSFEHDGTQGSWGIELGDETSPMIFDLYLINGTGVELLDETAFANGSEELGMALTNNDAYFFGFFAGESVGFAPVPAYAPAEWEKGSSIAHLNKTNFPEWHPDALMAPSLSPGFAIHDPGPILTGVFRDIFWTASSELYFAQFGAGGLKSDVVVTNPSVDSTVAGEVHFFDADGALLNPSDILADGSEAATFSLAPGGTVTFSSRSTGSLAQGSAIVTSTEPVSGVIRFDIPGTGVAGVGSSEPAFEVILPVRRSGGLSTGAAIRNVGLEDMSVSLTLKNQAGNAVQNGQVNVDIPAQGRASKFIQEYFPNANTTNFTGTMTVSSSNGKVAVVGLEFENGAKFTTLPVSPLR
jgi:hypothetical protein